MYKMFYIYCQLVMIIIKQYHQHNMIQQEIYTKQLQQKRRFEAINAKTTIQIFCIVWYQVMRLNYKIKIYSCVLMNNNEDEIIMTMVDTIFQNIGYRRWISGIEVFQNQQIYFEICNFIFPASSIQMIKIRESKLNNAEKIQQLINLIGREISMDLSHISGFEIASGNIIHLYNLLQLLVELTNHIIGKHEGQTIYSVKSAPPIRDSVYDPQDQNSVYRTVIGVPQEFFYTDSDITSKIQQSQSEMKQKQPQILQKLMSERKNQIQKKQEQIQLQQQQQESQDDYQILHKIGFPDPKDPKYNQKEEPKKLTKQEKLKKENKNKKKEKKVAVPKQLRSYKLYEKYKITSSSGPKIHNRQPAHKIHKIQKQQQTLNPFQIEQIYCENKISYITKTNLVMNKLEEKRLKQLKVEETKYNFKVHDATAKTIKKIEDENQDITRCLSVNLNKVENMLKTKQGSIVNLSKMEKILRHQFIKSQNQHQKQQFMRLYQNHEKLNRLIIDDNKEIDGLIQELQKSH